MVENSQLAEAAEQLLAEFESLGPLSKHRQWQQQAREEEQEDHTATLLDTCKWYAEQFRAADAFLVIDQSVAQELVQRLESLRSNAESIRDFRTTQDGSQSAFRSLSREVQRHTVRLVQYAGPWLSPHILRQADKPTSRIDAQLREADSRLRNIRTRDEESQSILDQMQSMSVESGSELFGTEFQKEAKKDMDSFKNWLIASGAALAAAVGVAVWILCTISTESATVWSWLQGLTSKVFILSLATYAATWCGRVALAKHHNASVNKHRANSINTVKAFRDAGKSASTKDAIVLEAARGVFENVQTGYVAKMTDGSPPSRTLEVLRTFGGSNDD